MSIHKGEDPERGLSDASECGLLTGKAVWTNRYQEHQGGMKDAQTQDKRDPGIFCSLDV